MIYFSYLNEIFVPLFFRNIVCQSDEKVSRMSNALTLKPLLIEKFAILTGAHNSKPSTFYLKISTSNATHRWKRQAGSPSGIHPSRLADRPSEYRRLGTDFGLFIVNMRVWLDESSLM